MKKNKVYKGFYLDEDTKLVMDALHAEYKELNRSHTYSSIFKMLVMTSPLSLAARKRLGLMRAVRDKMSQTETYYTEKFNDFE